MGNDGYSRINLTPGDVPLSEVLQTYREKSSEIALNQVRLIMALPESERTELLIHMIVGQALAMFDLAMSEPVEVEIADGDGEAVQ